MPNSLSCADGSLCDCLSALKRLTDAAKPKVGLGSGINIWFPTPDLEHVAEVANIALPELEKAFNELESCYLDARNELLDAYKRKPQGRGIQETPVCGFNDSAMFALDLAYRRIKEDYNRLTEVLQSDGEDTPDRDAWGWVRSLLGRLENTPAPDGAEWRRIIAHLELEMRDADNVLQADESTSPAAKTVNGGAGSTTTKTRKTKRGRKRLCREETQRRTGILSAWEKAHSVGTPMKTFCRNHGPALTVKELETIVAWKATRTRREAGN